MDHSFYRGMVEPSIFSRIASKESVSCPLMPSTWINLPSNFFGSLPITCKFMELPNILNTKTWRRGAVVITTAQLHSTEPELKFCAGSNPARGVSEIRDGEDLWQWSRLGIRLNAFRRSTIPQKQFTIVIIIIIIIIKETNELYTILVQQKKHLKKWDKNTV